MRFNHGGVIGSITDLPGCSQIAVFHGVFVKEYMRRSGKGSSAHALRLAEAGGLGYDAAICTVDASNVAQIRIMEKFNWIKAHTIKSTKTGNTVHIFIKNIK